MIGTIIALVSLFGILGIGLAKMINICRGGTAYPTELIFVGTVLVLFFWGLYFINSSNAVRLEEISTSDTGVTTVTNNNYILMFGFMPIVNFLLIINAFFTVLESVLILRAFSENGRMKIDAEPSFK